MLRSQTSALIPGALRTLTAADALIACPGIVYRRDAIDRLHTGTPHQLDLWRVTAADRPPDLIDLVATAVSAALPGTPWRTRPAEHPYTTGGLEIEAWSGEAWVEIGECGVAAAQVLPAGRCGLALGLGLDRLVMLRKGIGDIRLLRSADPRVAGQMTDLTPYRPVPSQPAARRDLSVAMPPGVTAEDLGDRVRDLLGADAHLVEEVAIRSVTAAADLPAASRERLRIRDDEVNVLLRVLLRDPHATLPGDRANELRDRIWAGLSRV
ncbi:PheS-related mystery ligase SrmL [Paractinoplanes durhamensis]